METSDPNSATGNPAPAAATAAAAVGRVSPPLNQIGHSTTNPSSTHEREDREDGGAGGVDRDKEVDSVGSLAGEELDMFDIELQREFQAPRQAQVSPSGGAVPPSCPSLFATINSRGGSGVNNSNNAGGTSVSGGLALRSLAALGGGGTTPPIAGGLPQSLSYTSFATAAAALAGDAASYGAKQFASVAGACQVSAFAQNKEECGRLLQLLANEIRREMGINNPAAPGGVTPATTLNSTADELTTAAAGASRSTSPTAAALAFEENLRLVSMVVHEIRERHHPQQHIRPGMMHPQSTTQLHVLQPLGDASSAPVTVAATSGGMVLGANVRGGGGATGPIVTSTSPVSGVHANGRVPAIIAGGGGNGPGSAYYHHRTSPAGGSSRRDPYNSNGGRNTIDTEVSDSLGRISASNPPHQYHEYERPMNPYPGMPHGAQQSSMSSRRPVSPGQQQQQQYYYSPTSAGLHHSGVMPGQQQHSRAAPTHGTAGLKPGSGAAGARKAAGVRSSSGNNNNSNPGAVVTTGMSSVMSKATASNVVHPLALKPQPTTKGRIRGPRSQTGKNVAPSNRSAFSECSGGETRSYNSNITAFHQNLSSTDVTTNTSLSSGVFRPSASGVVVVGNSGVSVNGGSNGIGNGNGGSIVVGEEGMN